MMPKDVIFGRVNILGPSEIKLTDIDIKGRVYTAW